MTTDIHTALTSKAMNDPAPENFQVSACPACGGSKGQAVFQETCEGVVIDVVICSDCGLGFSNPRPSEEYKLRRYEQWAKEGRQWDGEAHYDHRQQLRHFDLYKRVMQLVNRRVPKGRVLDVGCGGGLFLVFAGVFCSEHNAGINSSYEAEGAGFDPREIELARQVSGVPVHKLSELPGMPAARFDAVTMLNVLEHVNRPLELLRELRRVLRPSGVLVTVVPNNSVAFFRLRHRIGKPLTSLACHEHINHFRAGPLRSLLNRAGFQDVQFLPALPAGTYGSMVTPPRRQWLKHAAYRSLDLVTAGRMYLYSEIICTAQ